MLKTVWGLDGEHPRPIPTQNVGLRSSMALGIAVRTEGCRMVSPQIVSKSGTITLEAGLGEVFPLFGPVREMDWAEGWNPKILTGDPDHVAEHMVFETESGHPEDRNPATWIVSKYDPDRAYIEYTVYTQKRLWWIAVSCRAREGATTTEATIEYTYLGLDEDGNRHNRDALERMFRHDLKDWQAAINHYLRTGKILRHSHPGHHSHV